MPHNANLSQIPVTIITQELIIIFGTIYIDLNIKTTGIQCFKLKHPLSFPPQEVPN